MTFLDGPGIGTSGGCENEGEVGADGVVDIIAWNAGPRISLEISNEERPRDCDSLPAHCWICS
jgi:hypothetical protein